jgi:hypothetical protein
MIPGVTFALPWKGLLALIDAFGFPATLGPYKTIRAIWDKKEVSIA